MATNIWGYYAHSYDNLLASRIIGGFMSAAADATVPSVVADLFYFHERGHCMMFFHISISAGVFLGPLINAYLVQYAGWRWMLGFAAIASGATFVVGFFSIHETAYSRDKADLELPKEAYPPKRTFLSSLSLSHGYDPEASFFRWFASTLVLLAYPPVVIVGLTIGVCVGWYVSSLSSEFQLATANNSQEHLYPTHILSDVHCASLPLDDTQPGSIVHIGFRRRRDIFLHRRPSH
jgi:MFS family permease